MIISKFNRYFAKHGRNTYIVLGIIISVIFVFSLGDGMDGCGYRQHGLKSFGKMYGKNLSAKMMTEEMRKTSLAYMIKTGQDISKQAGDSAVLQLTLQKMRGLRKAKEMGLDKVADQDIRDAIMDIPFFGGKENFQRQAYDGFVKNFLPQFRMTAADFDEVIKESIIIDRLEAKITEGIEVTQDEVNEFLESYKISTHAIVMDTKRDAAPSNEEIQKFFETRKSEIKLENQRSAIVATATAQDIIAKADAPNADKALKDKLAISEDEIKNDFEATKDRLYKEKKLEEVKEQINDKLRLRKASELANKTIGTIIDELAKSAPKDETVEAKVARFVKIANEAGATVAATGFFTTGDTIPNMKSRQPGLARSIRALNNAGETTQNVTIIGGFCVAILKEIKPGEMPKEINDELQDKIADKLTAEKAIVFFNEKIAPYKDKLAGVESVWDLWPEHQKELEAKKLDMDQMMAEYSKFREFLTDYLMPFFKEELRSAKVVAFKPATFEERITVAEDELKAEYEKKKAEYEKKQVRLNQIVVNIDEKDDDATKAAKKAKLEKVLEQLKQGMQFNDLVKDASDDEDTKEKQGDTGLVNVNTLDEEVANAALALEIGQVSKIIETKNAYWLVKLAEKDMGKTFNDKSVQDELTKAIKANKAKNMAADKALELSNQFTDAATENDKAGQEKKSDVELFNAMLSTGIPDAEVIDLFKVNKNATIPNIGRETKLMEAIFGRKPDAPFTYMVAGTNASFVACVTEVIPSYMVIPSEQEADALNRLKNLYKKETAMAAALKIANDKVAAINKELAAGATLEKAAGNDKFIPVKDEIDFQNIYGNRELNVRDHQALLKALHLGKEGAVTTPVKTYNGYILPFLEKRTVKDTDEAKSLAEQIKSSKLRQKQQKRLSDFYAQLETESNTKLVEELIREK